MGFIGLEERPYRIDEVTKAVAIQWWNQENESKPYSKIGCIQTYWTKAENSTCYVLSSREPSKLFFHAHEAFY